MSWCINQRKNWKRSWKRSKKRTRILPTHRTSPNRRVPSDSITIYTICSWSPNNPWIICIFSSYAHTGWIYPLIVSQFTLTYHRDSTIVLLFYDAMKLATFLTLGEIFFKNKHRNNWIENKKNFSILRRKACELSHLSLVLGLELAPCLLLVGCWDSTDEPVLSYLLLM